MYRFVFRIKKESGLQVREFDSYEEAEATKRYFITAMRKCGPLDFSTWDVEPKIIKDGEQDGKQDGKQDGSAPETPCALDGPDS